MKKDDKPWRNCRQMKLLKIFYIPTMFVVGFIPMLFIMHCLNKSIIILLAVAYFFSILGGYLFLWGYIDNKLEKKWKDANKGNA